MPTELLIFEPFYPSIIVVRNLTFDRVVSVILKAVGVN